MQTKRVFAAFVIPDQVRDAAAHRIEMHREQFGNGAARWVRPENLHVTVRFFGDLTMSMIEGLKRAAINSAKLSPSFIASMTEPGVFPHCKPPKVLWMGLEPEAGFQLVKGNLEKELVRAGFEPEERRFHPHLTLARIKSPGTARSLAEKHLEAEFEPVSFSVDRLTVFESVLKPSGSEYFKLFEEELSG